MENLVCDLKNALVLNKKFVSKRNLYSKSTNKNKIHRHTSSSHQKNKIDCCKLTKSLVSHAVLSASSLNNLVRLKKTNTSDNQLDRSKLYVKTKTHRKIYKIQKTFRFRNYRLRCVRLRRESRQQQRLIKNSPHKTLNNVVDISKGGNKNKTTSSMSTESIAGEDKELISTSSSVDSSSDNSDPSDSFVTTSISSDSDNDLSLTEYFKSAKFLNSSDPSREDESCEDRNNNKLRLNSNSTLTRRKSSSQSKSSKPKRRIAGSHRSSHLSQMSIGLINGEGLKRKRLRVSEDEEAIGNSNSLLATQRRNSKSRQSETTKKLRLKNSYINKNKLDSGSNQQIFLRYLKKDTRCFGKLVKKNCEDTSEKETDDDTTREMMDLKKKGSGKKVSGGRYVKLSSDHREADDEQSDWPANEKTSVQPIRSELLEEEDVGFNVVPWWEKKKKSYYENCLQNSNYECVNRNEDEEEVKEFDEILNGALSIMSSTGKDMYHAKMKSTTTFPKYRCRSNSLATGSMRLATKSTTDLDSFLRKTNAPVDLENAPALTESNKGYKLLQKMGWQPGLGSQPIIAMMRPNRLGFGFDNKKKQTSSGDN